MLTHWKYIDIFYALLIWRTRHWPWYFYINILDFFIKIVYDSLWQYSACRTKSISYFLLNLILIYIYFSWYRSSILFRYIIAKPFSIICEHKVLQCGINPTLIVMWFSNYINNKSETFLITSISLLYIFI